MGQEFSESLKGRQNGKNIPLKFFGSSTRRMELTLNRRSDTYKSQGNGFNHSPRFANHSRTNR